MSTSSSRKNDARQALPSTAFTEVSGRAVPVPAPPGRRGPAAQLAARHTPRNAGLPRAKRCTAAAAALRLRREGGGYSSPEEAVS
jgi:hypothetical protein